MTALTQILTHQHLLVAETVTLRWNRKRILEQLFMNVNILVMQLTGCKNVELYPV
ncbi:MAG: hypothetical protein AB4352_11155 [Hormoscilla sp.]